MKTLIINRGCPGNGKTTLAKKIRGAVAIAADDMPGLYEKDGTYNQYMQKLSHEWCQAGVESMMKDGIETIVVHNTFTKLLYIQPYLQLAKKYGYAVHIVHSEAVILPDGSRTQSEHNVPGSVLDSMKQGWEPFDPAPKRGITTKQLSVELANVRYPDVIVFDKDGTITRPREGRTFPQSPDDFELVPEFHEWADGFPQSEELALYIVTNQRGLSTGQKTFDFLQHEIGNLTHFLRNYQDIDIDKVLVAPAYDSNQCWIKFLGQDWERKESYERTDKPGTGMFDSIVKSQSIRLNPASSYWIVGDAHTDDRPEDWEFAQACKAKYPDVNITYVPIEMIGTFWTLVN